MDQITLEIEYWDKEERTCTIRQTIPADYLEGDDVRSRALLAGIIAHRKGGLHRIKKWRVVEPPNR